MQKTPALLSIFLALLFIGCNNSKIVNSKIVNSKIVNSKIKLEKKLKPLSAIEKLAKNNNDFAFNMFEKLQEDNHTNILFSPYSISQALVVTYAGAKAKTKSQIATALHFNDNEQQLHKIFSKLNSNLTYKNIDYSLDIANSLWLEKDYKLLDRYSNTIKEKYGFQLIPLDYVNEPEKSRQIINSWVQNKTHNKIIDMLSSDNIKRTTKLVIINAIYFNGKWILDFKKRMTRNEPFILENNTSIKIPIMNQLNNFAYKEGESFQAIELPYKGGKLSMLVVLPKQGKENKVIENINNIYFNLKDNLSYKLVYLKLPKFEFTTEIYSLRKQFEKLGMINAFELIADFGNMVKNQKIKIDNILHKSFIKVDEKGTEASSATAVVMGDGASGPAHPPIRMFINRPFIFFIKDNISNQIIFMGFIKNPKR